MFHHYGKRVKSSQTKLLKDLTRIVPASLLLGDEKRRILLQQIKATCGLEEARFDSLCLSLMHNLANHCQQLPETSVSYYSQQGGLLDHALNRTEAALSLFQDFLLHDKQESLSEEQKLWLYALFSAAMLQGIGKLQMEYSIDLYDNQGEFLKRWNPLLENLTSVGHHYNYEFKKESDEALRTRLNLLLAHMLMPAGGFAWLASNQQVLAVWLALLDEDTEGSGTLGAVLARANAIAIQRYFGQLSLKSHGTPGWGGRYNRAATFSGRESVAEIEQQIGVEFLQWLTNALESGRIILNKAPLFMVPGGLLMSTEMFSWFVREHPEYKSLQAIRNGLLSLGLHQIASDGSVNLHFEQKSNNQMQTGIVLDRNVALPNTVQVIMPTGEIKEIPAIQLSSQLPASSSYFTAQQQIQMAEPLSHLNTAGQWVSESPEVAVSLHFGVPTSA